MSAAKEEIDRVARRRADPIQMGFKDRTKNYFRFHWRGLLSFFIPLVWIPVIFLSEEHRKAMFCSYVLLVMTSLFIFEIFATAIISSIPMVAFPVFIIMSAKDVSYSLFTGSLFTFLTAVWIAITMSTSNLSRRIAYLAYGAIGSSVYLLLAFWMGVTFLLCLVFHSSFICPLIYPMIDVTLEELDQQNLAELYDETDGTIVDDPPPYPSENSRAFYLGIAYASLIGGANTWFGSTIFQNYDPLFQTALPDEKNNVNIYQLSAYIFVQSLFLILVTYFWLLFVYSKSRRIEDLNKASRNAGKEKVKPKLDELGKLSRQEIGIIIVLVLAALFFLSRDPKIVPGWASYFDTKIAEEQVSVAAILICLAFPITFISFAYWIARRPNPEGTSDGLASPKLLFTLTQFAFLLIIAGGTICAKGIQESGLMTLFGYGLDDYSSEHSVLAQFFVLIGVIAFSCCTFNIHLANYILPEIFKFAVKAKMSPVYLAVPATTMLSYQFMFPISSAPTCLAHVWGNVRVWDMMLVGLPLTLLAFIVVFACGQSWIFLIWSGIVR